MQQAPLFILIRFAGLARLPDGGKTFVLRGNDVGFHFEEIFGDKVLDLFIAAHHQPQHRSLDATHREHPLITGVTPENGVGAGHVDAVQPVGAGASQRGDAQRHKLAVGSQTRDGTLHRLRVEIVDQTALHLAAFLWREVQVIQHLVH
ncbi:hypothetical protein D3C76_1448940 [compost metagenome]